MIGSTATNDQECVYCGQCLNGCPYGCIYNSGDDLMGLMKGGRTGLRHLPDTIVDAIKEKGPSVTLSGFDRLSLAPVTLEAERVFLAAGVIPSAKIMLKSLGIYDTPVMLRDSQYFLFPMLSLTGAREAVEEKVNTLSQIFVEMQDESLSPYTIHLQLYTYNDIITKTLEERFRFLPLLRKSIVRHLEHRVVIVQGYLHSGHSGKISLKLNRDSVTGKEKLLVKGLPELHAKDMVRKVLRKMGRHFKKLGLFPIGSALEFCQPGRGFHSGGSFPMKAAPGPLESDIYGRVGGLSRVHVVDASIFPSIPATTITLTAMANAHRIGSVAY